MGQSDTLSVVKVLAIDPGESTGWSVVQDSVIRAAGTTELEEFVQAFAAGMGILPDWSGATPDPVLVGAIRGCGHVVIEDWALYPWDLEHLAWDKCRTARGIGALEFILGAVGIPYTLQPAKIKDTAVAAGAEDLYYRPLHENRHQNDSLQHQVYWHLKQGLPPIRHQIGDPTNV